MIKVPGTWKITWYLEVVWEIFGLGIYFEHIRSTELRGAHFQFGPVQFGVYKEFVLDLDREE